MTNLQEKELIKLIKITKNPIITYVSLESHISTDVPYKISVDSKNSHLTYEGDIAVLKYDGLLTQHIQVPAQVYLGLDCDIFSNPTYSKAQITTVDDLGEYIVQALPKFITDMAIKTCCVITEKVSCDYIEYYQNGTMAMDNGCFRVKEINQNCAQHIANIDYASIEISYNQALGLLNDNALGYM